MLSPVAKLILWTWSLFDQVVALPPDAVVPTALAAVPAVGIGTVTLPFGSGLIVLTVLTLPSAAAEISIPAFVGVMLIFLPAKIGIGLAKYSGKLSFDNLIPVRVPSLFFLVHK